MSRKTNTLFCALSLVFSLFLLAGCATRRAYEAALVLANIDAGDQPSRLKRTTPGPTRTKVIFPVADQDYIADVHQSPEGSLAGIVLVPGAAERGKDDPRLLSLATSLARARFAVMVPDLPSLRALKVTPGNVQEVEAAFAWFRSQSGFAPGGKVGLGGISYAAGPALLAAMEPEIRDDVEFIVTIGAYHDLERSLTFLATGRFRKDGEWRHIEPREYGRSVLIHGMAARLGDSRDRRALEAMAQRRIADDDSDVDDLVAKLGPEGRKVFELMTCRDPEQVPVLLRELPKSVLTDIQTLDLAGKDLSRLKADLILIHGLDDDMIPYTESVSLARALPEGRARVFLVGGLQHVDLEPRLADKLSLLRAVYVLLGVRDRGSR